MADDMKYLFKDRTDDISMLTYTPRPKVYGIIRKNNVEHMYKVGWGGLDLFNLTPNEWGEKNSDCVWYEKLTLLRDIYEDSDDDYVFIKNYFNRDIIQWDSSNLTPV